VLLTLASTAPFRIVGWRSQIAFEILAQDELLLNQLAKF
jgi:hypothetical protein